MYRLLEQQTLALLKLPETGMGYQIANAYVNGKQARAFIFNAELLLLPGEFKEFEF